MNPIETGVKIGLTLAATPRSSDNDALSEDPISLDFRRTVQEMKNADAPYYKGTT
jgi:hypothetical protein